MRSLFLLRGTAKRHPDVADWFDEHRDPLGDLARHWFEVLRQCGDDVCEVLHDGQPTVCVENAAFAYVDAFKAHVNVGFFHGAALPDPTGLLQGSGRFMRHVKIRPDLEIDAEALVALIDAAYADVKARLMASSAVREQAMVRETE